MAQHEEIVLWLDRRWKNAIEKHLKGETLQEHLETVLDALCNQLPQREVKFLKFRIGLVASKSHINQILYEYEVNQTQYNAIMDLMDAVRKELDDHRDYNHVTFEQRMKEKSTTS